MAKKVSENDVKYVEKKLAVLHDQMERVEKHLRDHPWSEAADNRREAEFKLQKTMTDSLFEWTDKYIILSGIMDVYNQVQEVKGKKALRGGQVVSGIQSIVKQKAEEDAAKLLED